MGFGGLGTAGKDAYPTRAEGVLWRRLPACVIAMINGRTPAGAPALQDARTWFTAIALTCSAQLLLGVHASIIATDAGRETGAIRDGRRGS